MLMVVIHVRFEQFLTSYASCVTSGIYQVLFTQKTPENANNSKTQITWHGSLNWSYKLTKNLRLFDDAKKHALIRTLLTFSLLSCFLFHFLFSFQIYLPFSQLFLISMSFWKIKNWFMISKSCLAFQKVFFSIVL